MHSSTVWIQTGIHYRLCTAITICHSTDLQVSAHAYVQVSVFIMYYITLYIYTHVSKGKGTDPDIERAGDGTGWRKEGRELQGKHCIT